MALDAGVMSVTLEYAKDLKDMDVFGKQDPYCVVRIGGQTFRTRTAVDGGRNPVWNETLRFNLLNENDLEIEVKDEDIGRDDCIGTATISLARVRQVRTDRINAPVVSRKGRKQKGFISVALSWAPNQPLMHAARPPNQASPYGGMPPQAAPAPQMPQPPQYQQPYAMNPYAAPTPNPQGYYQPPAGPRYPIRTPPPQQYPPPCYPAPVPGLYPAVPGRPVGR